ncbi:MAG: hypothetical protein ABIP29_00705 [Candidatus Eisenbacteria bacterium]
MDPGRFIPPALALAAAVTFPSGLVLDSPQASSRHAHAAMSEAAMEARVAAWFRVHPEHGRDRSSAATAAAADTFLAYSSPALVFDADGNLATSRDSITIFVGESVFWRLVNGSHTVTSGVPGDPDAGSLFDVGLTSQTPTFTFTYNATGRFPFYCAPHANPMRGVVRVQSLVGVEMLPLPAGATTTSGFVARPAPNPTRDFVIVRFALLRAGRARLDVLDARGRRVARPVDGTYEAGGYAVRWDRRGDDGGRALAGVYFLRLSVPGARQTERVVVTD